MERPRTRLVGESVQLEEVQPLAARVVFEGMIRPGAVRWEHDVLWAADLDDRRLLRLDVETGDVTSEGFVVGDRPAGFGWMDGRLLVGAEASRLVLRQDDEGRLVPHASVAHACRGELHELVVAPNDVAYLTDLGTTHHRSHWRESGRVVAVDADGEVEVVAEDLELPTGLVVTPDCTALFVAERVGARILVFAVRPDGTLDGPTVFATLPRREGFHHAVPGALAIDEAGRLWCVDELGGRVMAFDANGQVVEEHLLDDGMVPGGLALVGTDVVVAGSPRENRALGRDGCLLAIDRPVPATR